MKYSLRKGPFITFLGAFIVAVIVWGIVGELEIQLTELGPWSYGVISGVVVLIRDLAGF